MYRRSVVTAALAAAALGLGVARDAAACRIIEVSFTPSSNLQIVVWLEDASGRFVDTVFITQETGTYGLGNRPGIMQFNSEFLWPYGRREPLFPVWAHRHGVTYPKLVFQDQLDNDLSHSFTKSSPEPHYCRPLLTCDPRYVPACVPEPVLTASLDAGTCATSAFTDKGMFQRTQAGSPDAGVSLYPPRADLGSGQMGDSADVPMFRLLNDLDAVSHATPAGHAPYTIAWAAPGTIPAGNYVMWVEVSKERDPNGAYNYSSPNLPAYGEYGTAYRGQPSVVWSVPFILDDTAQTGDLLDYVGYGDPEGIDGRLRGPDTTITTTIEGSGAGRLLAALGPEGMYRVRVATHPSNDNDPPNVPGSLYVDDVQAGQVAFSFTEPSDVPFGGAVSGYDIRISPGIPLDAGNFAVAGKSANVTVRPRAPGTAQQATVSGLLPSTQYWLGVSAYDGCLNTSAPAVVTFVTPGPTSGEVPACFVATAAYGSGMAAEVSLLRRFRDTVLRRMALGELFVETYYTFGPAMAGVIRPSETLRAEARAMLAPIVDLVR